MSAWYIGLSCRSGSGEDADTGGFIQSASQAGRTRGRSVWQRTEIYVNGSLKVFNHRTNVELNNRLVCFDIKDLGKQLKKLGMLIVQDQVWNRVTVNRSAHKSTRYYIDEFHLLLKEEQTAAYSVKSGRGSVRGVFRLVSHRM